MKKRIIILVACLVVLLLLCMILFCDYDKEEAKKDILDVSAPSDAWESSEELIMVEDGAFTEISTETVEGTTTTEEILGGTESGQEEIGTEEVGYSEVTESLGEEAYVATTEQTTEVTLTTTTAQCDNSQSYTTEHTHSFVEHIERIHHPEEGHFEEYCVTEGYTEELYKSYSYYCYSCGAIMDDWDTFSVMEHSGIHGAYGTATVVVETIEHPAVYEKVWVVDKESYYEEVITSICSQCGYVE